MKTILTTEEMMSHRQQLGGHVAFVPTMGALHAGHLSLIEKAKTLADHVICSIFVNPKQFGPQEDFSKYPRQIGSDLDQLLGCGIDSVFMPSLADIYPDDFSTKIQNERLSKILCGRFRPGHFDGVLTVVAKLFGIVAPHFSVFGKKDYQQVVLVSQMVKDFNMPVQVVACETLRAENGLALSSRNAYLREDDRERASLLYRSMLRTKERFQAGEKDPARLAVFFQGEVSQDPDFLLEYGEVLQRKTLQTPAQGAADLILLGAVRFKGVRLIDNLEL